MTAQWDSDGGLPVAPLPELGSTTLLEALESRDAAGLLEALAYDVVVLPVVPGPEPATRVFPSRVGRKPYDLLLFSSAKTLNDYLGRCPHRSFVARHGVAVLVYISDHLDEIDNVIFDAGSENEAQTAAEELAAFVVPTDEVAPPSEGEPAEPTEEQPEAPITGFAVHLEGPWGTIDLRDPETRKKQIDALVRQQTRALGDEGTILRHQIREWLAHAADQAASGGGEQISFLLAQHRGAAISLSMMKYWHDLGPQVGPIPHLDLLVRHLEENAGDGESLEHLETDGNRVVRHRRIREGNAEMGGSAVPLTMTDYWVACPDGRHLAHVGFSTPHVDQEEVMGLLTDNIALGLTWTSEDPA